LSAPPVTDAERARIRELHAQGLSCTRIAAEIGRSKSAVTRQCQAMGLAFDRAQTKTATAAKVADNAARRAEISRRFLEKSADLLDQMDQPHTAFNFGGKDNTYEEHEFSKPPVDALKTLVQAAGIAFDRHIAQDRHDAAGEEGGSAVDQWLRMMMGGSSPASQGA
jgi:Helix-turn-helix domain